MNFYVSFFGCRTNQAEIQEWIIELENHGYRLTDNIEEAEFGILNTCSVTEKAERDVIRFISKVYRKSNIPWVVAGCTVANSDNSLAKRYSHYLFLDNIEKKGIIDLIREKFPFNDNVIFHSSFRSRFFLKVQDGCNFNCSFCIVPSLRGKSVSIPPEELVEKAKYYSSLGYREVILTGINLSSYGYDLFPRRNILELIESLAGISDIDIVRLSSIDPRYIDYNFIKELSKIEKIAHSFHFSFQSGNDSILRSMKRSSKVKDYKKIMDDFSSFFPEANYGADFILGFPGEGEKEYLETYEFVKRSRLTYLHSFPFSPRRGTKAETMEPLPDKTVKKRVQDFKEMNRDKKLKYREKFRGRILDGILIEENENYALVTTKNYLSVRVPSSKGMKKRLVKVKITRIVNENLCEGTIDKTP
ncbi:MAG: MiaB/RimO family radical SAM methylthiotransferase [Acidobacteriota bacterium]